MIKSSCQLKMKAVLLSFLFLSIVVCKAAKFPFHLKDEQGKNCLSYSSYCFGFVMKLIWINTHAIFKSVTQNEHFSIFYCPTES